MPTKMPTIPALQRLRQEDPELHSEFRTNLNLTLSSEILSQKPKRGKKRRGKARQEKGKFKKEVEKWPKDINRHFPEEDIQVAHM
jgi:hypothetical protein